MSRTALCRISDIVVIAALATTEFLAADPTLREDALARFEPIPQTSDPATDQASVELGKALFFEPRPPAGHTISRRDRLLKRMLGPQ